MAVLQWMAVVLAVCSSTWGKLTVCPVNKLQFLSYNTTLLPRANVRASSESQSSDLLDHFIMQDAGPWCSDFNDVYNPNLHINFTFTEPVVITFLQSSGYFNAFVDSFSMQYALGREGGIFMPYGVLQVPQVFIVDHKVYLEEAYFSLEKYLVAERLKLQIHHSVFESSNRSCWSLKVLGCTFREAITIEEDGGDNTGSPEPCLPYVTTDDGMMSMRTAYPEPTTIPEPCTAGTGSSDSDPDPNSAPEQNNERILTIVLPVAVFTIVLCAVMVGAGVLYCYIVVARKPPEAGSKSKYHKGVTVRTLSHKGIPVPKEPGNEQKTMTSRKDSICSNNSDLFNYDMPRPIMYDVPRTPSQQQRAATVSCNEYRNPIYDRASSSKESNTYESIPYDLDTNHTGSGSLPKPHTRTRRASDMLPRSQARGSGAEQNEPQQALHSSDPQMAQYSVVDKSKKAKETVPVFEVLYDHSASKDDIDTPVTLPTS